MNYIANPKAPHDERMDADGRHKNGNLTPMVTVPPKPSDRPNAYTKNITDQQRPPRSPTAGSNLGFLLWALVLEQNAIASPEISENRSNRPSRFGKHAFMRMRLDKQYRVKRNMALTMGVSQGKRSMCVTAQSQRLNT